MFFGTKPSIRNKYLQILRTGENSAFMRSLYRHLKSVQHVNIVDATRTAVGARLPLVGTCIAKTAGDRSVPLRSPATRLDTFWYDVNTTRSSQHYRFGIDFTTVPQLSQQTAMIPLPITRGSRAIFGSKVTI